MTLDVFDTYFPFPEPTPFNGEPPAMPSVDSRDEEAEREQRWAFFEMDCRDFAASEPDGWAAVLRAVARAMSTQGELFRG